MYSVDRPPRGMRYEGFDYSACFVSLLSLETTGDRRQVTWVCPLGTVLSQLIPHLHSYLFINPVLSTSNSVLRLD